MAQTALATSAKVATLVVAALHGLFMVVETFLWMTPVVRERFGLTLEQAEHSRVLAANQGVYNGVLGALLAWAVATNNISVVRVLLGFVVAVGLYGGATVKPTIWLIQALPAVIALVLTRAPARKQ